MTKLTRQDIEKLLATSKSFRVDFSNHDLSELGSVLEGLNISRLDLSYSDLRGTWLYESELQGEYAGPTLVTQENQHEIDLANRIKTKVILRRVNMEGQVFHKARGSGLRGLDLREINLPNADCYKAHFIEANLEGANLQGSSFISARLEGANLQRANLHDAVMANASLELTDLRHTDLRETDLSRATFDIYTRWPENFNPVLVGAINTWYDPYSPYLCYTLFDTIFDYHLELGIHELPLPDYWPQKNLEQLSNSLTMGLKLLVNEIWLSEPENEDDYIFSFTSTQAIAKELNFVATCGKAGTVDLWRLEEGKAAHAVNLHHSCDGISFATFSSDKRLAATIGWDYSIKLWEVETGGEVRTLNCGPKPVETSVVSQAIFSPNGKALTAVFSELYLRTWDLASGREISTIEDKFLRGNCLAISPNGKLLAAPGWPNHILVWDAISGDKLKTLPGHLLSVCTLVFSLDNKLLASASYDNSVKIWELETNQELVMLTCGGYKLWPGYPLAFHPNGHILAVGVRKGTEYKENKPTELLESSVQLWSVQDGKLLEVLVCPHKGFAITSLAFSLDGRNLTGGFGNCLVTWEIRN